MKKDMAHQLDAHSSSTWLWRPMQLSTILDQIDMGSIALPEFHP
jgi:hypothetical protein